MIANAPATFTSPQLRLFLSALINLDPFDFAEDVAAFYAVDDENNRQTPEETLSSALTSLPDEKLTQFALRLALTGHTDTPRENDFDFLAQAETVFVSPEPTVSKKKAKAPAKAKPAANSVKPKKQMKKAALD